MLLKTKSEDPLFTQRSIFSVSFLVPCVRDFNFQNLFLEHPGDRDPLGVLRNRLQRSLDRAVGLVQVVVYDAEVEVLIAGRLDFGALIARPLQLFVLRWENTRLGLTHTRIPLDMCTTVKRLIPSASW